MKIRHRPDHEIPSAIHVVPSVQTLIEMGFRLIPVGCGLCRDEATTAVVNRAYADAQRIVAQAADDRALLERARQPGGFWVFFLGLPGRNPRTAQVNAYWKAQGRLGVVNPILARSDVSMHLKYTIVGVGAHRGFPQKKTPPGQVEGQVNRLKLIKRQMFGRASFALLRARVLRAG